MKLQECYKILGVDVNATPAQIKQAWRDLVMVWHPDKYAHNARLQAKAAEQIKQINEAYEILKRFTRHKNSEDEDEEQSRESRAEQARKEQEQKDQQRRKQERDERARQSFEENERRRREEQKKEGEYYEQVAKEKAEKLRQEQGWFFWRVIVRVWDRMSIARDTVRSVARNSGLSITIAVALYTIMLIWYGSISTVTHIVRSVICTWNNMSTETAIGLYAIVFIIILWLCNVIISIEQHRTTVSSNSHYTTNHIGTIEEKNLIISVDQNRKNVSANSHESANQNGITEERNGNGRVFRHFTKAVVERTDEIEKETERKRAEDFLKRVAVNRQHIEEQLIAPERIIEDQVGNYYDLIKKKDLDAAFTYWDSISLSNSDRDDISADARANEYIGIGPITVYMFPNRRAVAHLTLVEYHHQQTVWENEVGLEQLNGKWKICYIKMQSY